MWTRASGLGAFSVSPCCPSSRRIQIWREGVKAGREPATIRFLRHIPLRGSVWGSVAARHWYFLSNSSLISTPSPKPADPCHCLE